MSMSEKLYGTTLFAIITLTTPALVYNFAPQFKVFCFCYACKNKWIVTHQYLSRNPLKMCCPRIKHLTYSKQPKKQKTLKLQPHNAPDQDSRSWKINQIVERTVISNLSLK